jgi:hypothetical protein
MKANSKKVDLLALSRLEPGSPVSPSRRLQWRPGFPRLSAALPAALGLLCLLLAFKASLRFSGDLFFRASPASVAAASPADATPRSDAGSLPLPGGDTSSPGAHGKEPREPGGRDPAGEDSGGRDPAGEDSGGRDPAGEDSGGSTGCGEGPAQLPGVASLDLRGGSPLPAHHLAGAPPPRSEAEKSPSRLWRAVASTADLPRPLSAGIAPFLPRAPPSA